MAVGWCHSAATAKDEVAQDTHDDDVAAVDQHNGEHYCNGDQYQWKPKDAEPKPGADNRPLTEVVPEKLAKLVREVSDEDKRRTEPLYYEEEDPQDDGLGYVLHAGAAKNRSRTEMC